MLTKLMPHLQQAWLAKAVSAIQPNEQMHLPAPQAVLVQWTQDACANKDTAAEHAYNMARYWCHGLRFPAHGEISRNNLCLLLNQQHLQEAATRAANTLLALEIQPLRIVRLWALVNGVLPDAALVPHLERLLSEALPTGKKLKMSQINPENWCAWLEMQHKLTPTTFNAGLELHTKANLTSRQDADPIKRATAAWGMLRGCEVVLLLLPEPFELASLKLPRLLSVIVQYADSQTLRHLPWAAIQERFASDPRSMAVVWQFLFDNHKNLLLNILPDVQAQYHERLLYQFLELNDFFLEEYHCAPMLKLVSTVFAWSQLLNKMLAGKGRYRKLGTYLLGSSNPQSPPQADLMPGHYFAQFTAEHWHYIFMGEGRATYNSAQLFQIWELVRVHKLQALANSPWLQKATLQSIPQQVTRLNKVSVWDVSLGFPTFYAAMMQVYLLENEQEEWFNDWMEKPSAEKMIVQTFRWFNPSIEVPPLRDLQLLAQALGENATIVDILSHLDRKIETLELPSMLQL